MAKWSREDMLGMWLAIALLVVGATVGVGVTLFWNAWNTPYPAATLPAIEIIEMEDTTDESADCCDAVVDCCNRNHSKRRLSQPPAVQ